jgi:hypothetical protein
VTRVSATRFEQEELGEVRFVPLIGAQGWADDMTGQRRGKHSPEAAPRHAGEIP